MADAANRDAVAFLVDVAPTREKSVRLQVTMQPTIVAEIDERTAASNTTRSAWLAEAAREKIERERPPAKSG